MSDKRQEDHQSEEEVFLEDHELLAEDEFLESRSSASAKRLNQSGTSTLRDLVTLAGILLRRCFTVARTRFLILGVLGLLVGILVFNNHAEIATKINSYRTTSHPFAGEFARFPTMSSLPPEQRRLTLVGVWNDDTFPVILKHFFWSVQMNADSLDLLMINRLTKPGSKCLDFDKAGMDISWGGNIKFHCLDNVEWKRRHVEYMCGAEYGWDCDQTQFEGVTKEFATRNDDKNYDWRLFRGYVVRDLFQHPENPFWAWIDHDLIVGNFARYPLNILSQLSILTGGQEQPEFLYLAGQLTAFNFADRELGSAWKKFPEMKTPEHFYKKIDGNMPSSSEERYWSEGYLRSTDGLPGTNLSFGVYADLHGDDYFDGHWRPRDPHHVSIVSGRDVLVVSGDLTREQIEVAINMERNEPIDELGGIGWTASKDVLSGGEAKALSMHDITLHQGFVENIEVWTNCTSRRFKQCVIPHPLQRSKPPLMRASLIRLADQPPGYILRRMERDYRPRAYERKLIRHHLYTKKEKWFELPDFMISDDLVLRYNTKFVEVFRIGPSRDETLFYREEGKPSIG